MGTFLSLLGRFVPRWGGRKQHSFRRNYLTNESHGGMEKKWKRNGKRMEKMEKANGVFGLKSRFFGEAAI
jgi:hypothetical protein